MDGFFNILLIIDAVLAGIAFIVLIVKSGRSFYSAGNAKKTELVAISDGGTVKLLSDPNSKPAAAVEEKVIPLSGKTQEQSDELAAQELSATSVTIGDVDDAAQNPFKFGNLRIKRRPFAEKMLGLSLDVKEYYDKIDNELRSYKRVSARVSISGESYRVGRKLIAKVTVRGITLTMYLALDVNAFKQSVFFQKDSSGVKAYAEVPFTVKVKSGRGLNNALKLVAALAEKEGLEKDPRYKKINSVSNLKKLK